MKGLLEAVATSVLVAMVVAVVTVAAFFGRIAWLRRRESKR